MQSNTVRSNDGFGLELSDAAYRENVIGSNTLGSVSGGMNLGNKSCDGKATCP